MNVEHNSSTTGTRTRRWTATWPTKVAVEPSQDELNEDENDGSDQEEDRPAPTAAQTMTALKTLRHWMENVNSNDFSAYYKLEHMVHSHVASVRRQTKMHDFFTVPNH